MTTLPQNSFELDTMIADAQDPLHNAETIPVSTEYFRVGTPMQLTVNEKGQVQQEYSVLLGYRAGRFLLVELPKVGAHAMVITPNTEVRIRYMIDGHLLGFSSKSKKVQFEPERLLFLSYPSRVDHLALRRHERVRVTLPTLVRAGNDPSQLNAETRDISISGCGLMFPPDVEGLEKGLRMTLYFRLPGDDTLYKARAWSRVVKKRKDGTWMGCEFDFRPGEEETRTMVERMVLARTGMMSTSDLAVES